MKREEKERGRQGERVERNREGREKERSRQEGMRRENNR